MCVFAFFLAKPKLEPEIGCEIALFEGLAFENGLKGFHLSLSFSLYYYYFSSEIDPCLHRQPVHCSSQVRIEMTLAT